jgi:hypothetical protein
VSKLALVQDTLSQKDASVQLNKLLIQKECACGVKLKGKCCHAFSFFLFLLTVACGVKLKGKYPDLGVCSKCNSAAKKTAAVCAVCERGLRGECAPTASRSKTQR